VTKFRLDYEEPLVYVDTIDLKFELDSLETVVKNTFTVRKNCDLNNTFDYVKLDGEGICLKGLKINGIEHSDFQLLDDGINIENLPDTNKFEISITSSCTPVTNRTLQGLYLSEELLLTQCEPEGFRRITYFLDRPDVMARFKVTIDADKKKYPVLLSNGNLESLEEIGDGWHRAVWNDPFPKPSYLFALVAGKLLNKDRTIQTKSGKSKLLQIWSAAEEIDYTEFAMDSLVNAIRWDENHFDLELDLDRFMMVSVRDFNMGAMENKGLNIFNSSSILADPELSIDSHFLSVANIIAHEYFHNWTGNRITCRDWFQLSLKEGLTVFRDQEFSFDQIDNDSGKALRRIKIVNGLRSGQFLEDASPMAHPIRPDSYETIENFYTATIYAKGAEVIRMLQTILGFDRFRKGFDLYINRHDGQAVTCDDFINAMQDANQINLEQFSLWYSQAGTPRVKVKENFNLAKKEYTLTLEQYCNPTPNQSIKEDFYIPLKTKLISSEKHPRLNQEWLWELKNSSEAIIISGLSKKPNLSINRQFSAPIILEYNQTQTDLLNQLEFDDDAFNRWEGFQKINTQLILNATEPPQKLLDIYQKILNNSSFDPDYRVLIFSLPSENYLSQQLNQYDPVKLARDRLNYLRLLAQKFEKDWYRTYKTYNLKEKYVNDVSSISRRSLKNLCLTMLLHSNLSKWETLAFNQYKEADNMTDRFSALNALTQMSSPLAPECLVHFYNKYENYSSVIDTWFTIQALDYPTSQIKIVDKIKKLYEHHAFKKDNPNRFHSLITAFCFGNTLGYHQLDESGYELWVDQMIKIDSVNPNIASRLARASLNWKKFTPQYQEKMQIKINCVLEISSLSINSREILTKIIA
jgi:aminopeptidase N